MTITADLRVVVPLRTSDAGDVLVHGYHTPISREVFEANFRYLAATKNAIFKNGMKYVLMNGPECAALHFLDEVKKEALERMDLMPDGKPNIAAATALFADIRRLTMVLVPGPNGWDMVPVDIAISQGHIDAEDWREAESSLVFFTCAYSTENRRGKPEMAALASVPMKAQITSLPPMEWIGSLPMLTQQNNTTQTTSSVPS